MFLICDFKSLHGIFLHFIGKKQFFIDKQH